MWEKCSAFKETKKVKRYYILRQSAWLKTQCHCCSLPKKKKKKLSNIETESRIRNIWSRLYHAIKPSKWVQVWRKEEITLQSTKRIGKIMELSKQFLKIQWWWVLVVQLWSQHSGDWGRGIMCSRSHWAISEDHVSIQKSERRARKEGRREEERREGGRKAEGNKLQAMC